MASAYALSVKINRSGIGVPTWLEFDSEKGDPVPTRRIMELTIVVAILVRPAFGLVHLWAAKTLGTQQPGSLAHGVAEIVTVII